jgi:hypothetical protein
MPKLYAVNPADLARVWESVSALVGRALDADTQYSVADVRAGIEARTMQLWLGMEDRAIVAVAVTQILVFPRMKVADLFVIAGEGIEAGVPLLAGIEQWARREGCAAIQGCGRDGWKALLPSGWSAFATLYRKSL